MEKVEKIDIRNKFHNPQYKLYYTTPSVHSVHHPLHPLHTVHPVRHPPAHCTPCTPPLASDPTY